MCVVCDVCAELDGLFIRFVCIWDVLVQLGVELAKTGVINYTKPPSMDELRKFHLNVRSTIREGLADEDDDWSD